VFQHHRFTGRSGAMYGYEGIGSIYWHMVAKLALAVQETCQRARQESAPAGEQQSLIELYLGVRAGLGFNKDASTYGAFPADPYSHSPAHAGAQQPGMTGQVKEEILCRFGELGVSVDGGELAFGPPLVGDGEWLHDPMTFTCLGIEDSWRTIELRPGQLAFTICQTPVVYERAAAEGIQILFADDSTQELPGRRLPVELTAALFERKGRIRQITVRRP
jgi:hypothetical protein